MLTFVIFSLKRAWQGFWRNAVMSIAATATMVLMLLLLAGFWILQTGLQASLDYTESKVEVVADLKDNVKDHEVEPIVERLLGMPEVTEVTFVDIRPLEVDIEGLTPIAGSVLDMPFADGALESVSCLHVAEHIGLGRYGDPLDPQGTRKAAAELQRVLAPGGQLLFSLPVGRPRVEFNAHRVHDPHEVASWFAACELREFAGVDDAGVFRRHRSLDELAGARYACGMYQLIASP